LQVQLIHHFLRVILNLVIKSSVFIAYFSHRIIEFPLLLKVSVFVVVCLALEVGALVCLHGLPSAANLLHDLECTHIRIGFYYLGSRLNIKQAPVSQVHKTCENMVFVYEKKVDCLALSLG